MKILLIGGSNPLMNHLISRYRKEGHRLFLLTGSKYKNDTYETVFERYDFPYNNQSIEDVFDSIDPDVVIYLGAFDSVYSWKNEKYESVQYVAGVLNLLSVFAARRKGRFVYLSSSQIFSGLHADPISENAIPNPCDTNARAILQGEQLCSDYIERSHADIMILRLDTLYYKPSQLHEVDNIVSRFSFCALRDHVIEYDERHSLSLLYLDDAVQFITQATLSSEHHRQIYHIGSERLIGERELAETIADLWNADAGKKKAKVIVRALSANGSERTDCVALANREYANEFGINRFARQEDKIRDIVVYMRKHKDVFLRGTDQPLPWYKKLIKDTAWAIRALIPFVENMILFIPFFMLNNRAVGSRFFSKLDFYLLYVLLFAFLYGQQQATFSALLACAGYIFRQMYHRSGADVISDYNTYVWIAQLFILGLVVGYMRDQLGRMKEEAKEDHSYMLEQLDDIRDINGSNVRVKDALEEQVITQDYGIGRIYSITSKLEQYHSDEVIFYAAEILEQLMETNDVALYIVSNEDYARMFTATSGKASSLGNSIRYKELGDMYSRLMEHQVYINRKLDPNLPLMANAIFSGENIRLLVFLWGIPWERMTLGQANVLTVTSLLIQNAVLRADDYLEVVRRDRYFKDTNVMISSAFERILTVYRKAQMKNITRYSLIKVSFPEGKLLETGSRLSRSIRPNDYLGERADGSLNLLLSNTDDTGAAVVLKRLEKQGFTCSIVAKEKEA